MADFQSPTQNTVSGQLLIISKDRDPTASLGNMCQCSVILTTAKVERQRQGGAAVSFHSPTESEYRTSINRLQQKLHRSLPQSI